MRKFIGRKNELGLLSTLLELRQSSLVVITGRLRIGKSRLLNEFAKQFETTYTFSGIPPKKDTTAQTQREEFARQLKKEIGIRGIEKEDWGDLFWHLAQNTKSGKMLIILDEITWMGDKDTTFLPKLKNAWDLHFSKNHQLLLAISGSLSAWIDKNILSSTGFLGRVSLEMHLEELPLQDCLPFWDRKAHGVSAFEKLKLLAITGGIPRYLENIITHQSAEENIHRLCFKKNSMLSQEFKKVFSDLYNTKNAMYKKIIRCLADGQAEQKIIAQKIGLQRGGKISDYLSNLTKSGFVSRDYTWKIQSGKYSKISQYRLKDNYTQFYLKHIEPNLINIDLGNYENTSINEMFSWHTIIGLQIENLILSNRKLIQQQLNIKPGEIVCDNPFFQKNTTRQKGCQIDYMIQTKHVLFICEIKYSKNEITTKVIEEMKEKINRLKIPKHFSYRCVLIHANQVNKNVEESHFFSHIIDFTELISQQS